jgi:hypothetical protein
MNRKWSHMLPHSVTGFGLVPSVGPTPFKNLFGDPQEFRKPEQLEDSCVGQPVPGHVVEGRIRAVR